MISRNIKWRLIQLFFFLLVFLGCVIPEPLQSANESERYMGRYKMTLILMRKNQLFHDIVLIQSPKIVPLIFLISKIKNPGVCDQQCLIDKNAFFYDMERQSLANFLGRDPHSIDNFLSTITKDCSIHLHDNPRSNMFFFSGVSNIIMMSTFILLYSSL